MNCRPTLARTGLGLLRELFGFDDLNERTSVVQVRCRRPFSRPANRCFKTLLQFNIVLKAGGQQTASVSSRRARDGAQWLWNQ